MIFYKMNVSSSKSVVCYRKKRDEDVAGIQLYDYQLDAVKRMKNGCILCGGVGSGKSRTGLAYYYILQGGEVNTKDYVPMDDQEIRDLYIITTAHKRDTKEWEKELVPFLLSTNPAVSGYSNRVVVDSWNNIQKYKDILSAFFIFDEDRVTGSGVWVKSFLNIARKNQWILLSATPGDKYEDYIPVFVANGFYKNRTEFKRRHCVYSAYSKYPKVVKYLETGKLNRLRRDILVDMDFKRETIAHHEDIYLPYDIAGYKDISRKRWDPWKDEPIANASGYCYCLRKMVNSDVARTVSVVDILANHPKAIIFYNFDYELEALRRALEGSEWPFAEWNGHQHDKLPTGPKWAYLVQYTAGCEGWNCIETDTMIFYSQNYSYKVMQQASGRIDRLNTPYKDLYYYHLKSHSGIDTAISKALRDKKKFNEEVFASSGRR